MNDLLDYVPRNTVRDTSVEAFKSTDKTIKARVYRAMCQHDGGSASFIAHMLNLDLTSVRPKLTELSKANMIADTGNRATTEAGKSEIIWRVTEPWEWSRQPDRQTPRERIAQLEEATRELVEALRDMIQAVPLAAIGHYSEAEIANAKAVLAKHGASQ